MVVQVFLPLGGLVNTYHRCTLHTRGEAGGQNRQRKLLKCFLSCLKILILFHCFLRFICHGDYLLEPSPSTPPAPGWRSHASSQYRSEGQQWGGGWGGGGPSPPLPHSSACLAPLALVAPRCWALGLCGCKQVRNNTFKYSHLGWGPLRAKGTESLVLGAQQLVIWGWAMPPGSGERWEWRHIGKGSQRWGFGWE